MTTHYSKLPNDPRRAAALARAREELEARRSWCEEHNGPKEACATVHDLRVTTARRIEAWENRGAR